MDQILESLNIKNIIKYISVLFLDFKPIELIRIAADILIVAICFYSIMRIIKDTRAWQLLKGVLFVVIASKLSQFFGLKTLAYLTNALLSIVGIVIVVVFAPELRKVLEQLGRSNVKNIIRFDDQSQKRIEMKNIIDEIVNAATNLARDKTGALIVIEGATKLGDIVNTGTHLDAIVSAPLLENIFVTKTPLHDGAVIVRENRIMAAACFLPLTSNNNISLKYGTRHRAAIGISEVSDAIAVAVSEERGEISFVYNGTIRKMDDGEMLRKELVKMLITYEEKRINVKFSDKSPLNRKKRKKG